MDEMIYEASHPGRQPKMLNHDPNGLTFSLPMITFLSDVPLKVRSGALYFHSCEMRSAVVNSWLPSLIVTE